MPLLEQLILQLSKRYFVKHLSDKSITVIAHYNKELRDINDTYDSLTLTETFVLSHSVQGVFEFN